MASDYRFSKITAASVWTRPKLSGPDVAGHWGVVVDIEGCGKYLIHNTPDTGVVVTDAAHMSSNWKKVADVPVKGTKTVRDALRASGGAASTYVSSALARYVMGDTCVGTAAKVAEYLLL